MWDGVFAPLNKRGSRTPADHLLDNGKIERGDKVTVNIDPITEEDFEKPRSAQKVDLTYRGKTYTYLIFTRNNNASDREIREQINEYMNNRIEGGRDWESYLSDEDRLEELLNGPSI